MIDNDEILIAGLKKQDPSAQERFYKEYAPKIYSKCSRMLPSLEDAEEAANQIFYAVMSKIKSFKGDSAFNTWVYRVAHNECLMKLRYNKHCFRNLAHEQLENVLYTDNTFEALSDPFLRDKIDGAFLKVNKRWRTVLEMRGIDGLTSPETATILGVGNGAVKSMLHRGRAEFKKYLEAA